jgi:hypothetical protein
MPFATEIKGSSKDKFCLPGLHLLGEVLFGQSLSLTGTSSAIP